MASIDFRKIDELRRNFIDNGEINKGKIRPEILESWNRSGKSGVNPDSLILPSYISKQEASTLRGDRFFRTESAKTFSNKLYSLLENTGSAIFYTDENLTVIIQRGSKALIAKLNSVGLQIGTNLSESRIGTNAVALSASHENNKFSVIGGEHYVAALHGYACTAMPMMENDTNLIYGYSMFITTIENYNPYQFTTFEYFILLTSFNLDLFIQDSKLTLYNTLLTQSVEQQDKGVIFVDINGFIIKVNSWISLHFGRGSRGEKFVSTFPDLSEAMECMRTKSPLLLKEVNIDTLSMKRASYYMECYPIKKDNLVKGMIVTIINKKQVHNNLTKIYNFNAHFVFDDLIGSCQNFIEAKISAKKAAHSLSNILITGESGTGKELFAQSIHNASPRSNGPFISINCAAIPRELIGSELFGYAEGAFTGARKGGATGKFELADKGTIFLDEIGEMPLDMQSILLRVLEEKKVTRLGGSHPIPIDVKVITATNKKLWNSVLSNEFRLDLYYRLNVINIEIPPLRERKEDIPLLINYFINYFKQVLNSEISGVTPQAVEMLMDYDFPGNVRELRNIIERGINQTNSNQIAIDDLPKEIVCSNYGINDNDEVHTGKNREQKISKLMTEKEKILSLLEKYNGNKTLVAKELGISRVTLYNKLK